MRNRPPAILVAAAAALLAIALAPSVVNGDGLGFLKAAPTGIVVPGHLGYLPILRLLGRLFGRPSPLGLLGPARALSVAAGTTAAAAVYATARRLLGARGALVAIEGDPSFNFVRDVPDPIDGVVIMVPPDAMAGVVDDVLARGVPRVWFHRGLGQHAIPEELVTRCREAGVTVVDGACPLMFMEPVRGVHRMHRALVHRRLAA